MTVKRDKKGRFVKGNKEGRKFSKSNPPKNPGRKPSKFREYLDGFGDRGNPNSLEDYKKIALTLLSLTKEEFQKEVQNEKAPMIAISLLSAIGMDAQNGRMDSVDRILDRIFGKSTNSMDVTSKGDKLSQGIQIEILDVKDKDK